MRSIGIRTDKKGITIMGFAQDGIEEFKKLPTGGKVAVAGVFLLVAGVGFYEYRKSQSTSSGLSTTASTASPSTDTQAAQQSQLPFLPYGSTALTDASGTPFAFVNPAPTSTPASTSTGTTTPNPRTPLLSSLPSNFPKWVLGSTANVNGQLFTLVPGGTPSNPVLYGVPGRVSTQTALNTPIQPGGKQVLYAGKGGGPMRSRGMGGGVITRYEVKQNGHINAVKYRVNEGIGE